MTDTQPQTPRFPPLSANRVEEAYRQPDLFIEPPKPTPTQEGFDL